MGGLWQRISERKEKDAPQRPSESPQRQHLLLLLFAQDVGVITLPSASSTSRRLTSGGRFSGVHG